MMCDIVVADHSSIAKRSANTHGLQMGTSQPTVTIWARSHFLLTVLKSFRH